ncbi:Fibrinogen C domain-containing protein 1 [Holothuria leucospilota]|uniref:Fibrinogen C domain-containing protein 1 n=1 Tax=Holothuria leucospilota TaxID=206669 RepID=A0A9Q1H4N1_HOLLE|nr:Fibrinogen C domain-containing protein 1 [Holothuria leucospilota]
MCNDFQCDINAICQNESGILHCNCKQGYYGDGLSCTRLTDCEDVYNAGLVDDDVYTILPMNWNGSAFEVYCKDGWTVIFKVFQRREDGSVDFFLYWGDYKEGFGDPRHEMWLGLEKLFYLTNQRTYELKISLISDNTSHEITHDSFRISDENDNYRLTELGHYTSTLASFYILSLGFDLLSVHHNFQFSTRDRDNDNHPTVDCAANNQGAWWFKQCFKIYLNGPYGSPVQPGICYIKDAIKYCNIPFTEMSIKPV